MTSELNSLSEKIAKYVDTFAETLTAFVTDLVRIPSQTGSEEQVARFIAQTMTDLGYDEVSIDEYGSVIGRVGTGEQKILFDGHIDTVAVNDADLWLEPPFGGNLIGDRLYGRGASDMKGAVAATVFMAAAARDLGLLQGKSLYISASSLEEDFDGESLFHICKSVRPDAVLICEPSQNNIVLGQKGRAVLRIDFSGVSAHGSAPEDGINAIYKASEIISRISHKADELHATPGSGSLALTCIESEAVSLNAVPARCSLYLDRRLQPGEDLDFITAEMDELLSGSDAEWSVHTSVGTAWTGTKVSLFSFLPAWEIPLHHPLTEAMFSAFREAFFIEPQTRRWDFSTNGVASAKLGIPTIGFGPGDDKLAHTRDEYVSVSQILKACEFWLHLLLYL
ncbi:MAG: YgeY family selenium metabolism-linked hydrolase [Symbiobacteriaceae bacterium]|nr:YgeY family selenium metabolism-linked hydrolase [Symbiobacteriaceae bacterium]